jgi:hypothetical protein
MSGTWPNALGRRVFREKTHKAQFASSPGGLPGTRAGRIGISPAGIPAQWPTPQSRPFGINWAMHLAHYVGADSEAVTVTPATGSRRTPPSRRSRPSHRHRPAIE